MITTELSKLDNIDINVTVAEQVNHFSNMDIKEMVRIDNMLKNISDNRYTFEIVLEELIVQAVAITDMQSVKMLNRIKNIFSFYRELMK